MNEALEKSIVHWKEIRDGVEMLRNRFVDSCSLCSEYYKHFCAGCPLYESDDDCHRDGSTYDDFADGFEDADDCDIELDATMSTITLAQREILYPLADNMVKKLESLR